MPRSNVGGQGISDQAPVSSDLVETFQSLYQNEVEGLLLRAAGRLRGDARRAFFDALDDVAAAPIADTKTFRDLSNVAFAARRSMTLMGVMA